MGCFQAFAILPGISRSGSTILGGRLMGLKNDDSVTFSFLASNSRDPWGNGADAARPLGKPTSRLAHRPLANGIAIGAAVAFAVGIVSLLWLIGWSRQDRLHWFAWWCIPVGLLAIAHFGMGLVHPTHNYYGHVCSI